MQSFKKNVLTLILLLTSLFSGYGSEGILSGAFGKLLAKDSDSSLLCSGTLKLGENAIFRLGESSKSEVLESMKIEYNLSPKESGKLRRDKYWLGFSLPNNGVFRYNGVWSIIVFFFDVDNKLFSISLYSWSKEGYAKAYYSRVQRYFNENFSKYFLKKANNLLDRRGEGEVYKINDYYVEIECGSDDKDDTDYVFLQMATCPLESVCF